MAKIDAFFNLMFEQKASDLHLSSGNPPMLRINGELHRVDYPPLESDNLKMMLYEIAPEYKIKLFEETGDVDFGYEIPNISRFRANFFNQKNGVAAVFRHEVDACADAAPVLAAEHPPGEALALWMQRYVDFIAAKRGLSAALHSGAPAFEPLPAYFRERLQPALRRRCLHRSLRRCRRQEQTECPSPASTKRAP